MNTHGRSDGHGALECCDSGLERTRSTQHQDAQRSSRDCPIESNFLSNYQTCGVSCLAAERKNVTRWWWVGLLGWVWRVLLHRMFHTGFSASAYPDKCESAEFRRKNPRERVGKRICFCVLLLWHLPLRETILVLTILGTCKRL